MRVERGPGIGDPPGSVRRALRVRSTVRSVSRILPLVVSGLGFHPAGAATLHVAADGLGEYPTIRAAVDAAVDGDEILLGDGLFVGAGNRDVGWAGKDLLIASENGARDDVILDLQGAGRAFAVEPAGDEGSGSIVRDITIRNGHRERGDGPVSDGWGGAIFVADDAILSVENVVLESNEASLEGGAVYVGRSATLSVTDCLFSDDVTPQGSGLGGAIRAGSLSSLEVVATRFERCYSDKGGAIYVRDGSAFVSGCEFSGNDADLGAGLYVRGQSEVTIDGADFVGNVATSRGGGFYSTDHGVLATLTGCRFQGNVAFGTGPRTGGAAVYLHSGPTVSIESSLLAGNYAERVGGAVYIDDGELTLTSTTIAANRAETNGGAIYGDGQVLFLERTILWGDCGFLGGAEVYLETGGQAEFTCTLVDPSAVVGSVLYTQPVDADPLFCAPRSCDEAPSVGGDYALQNGSPALPGASPCGLLIGAFGTSSCGPVCAPRDFISDLSTPPEPDPGSWDHDVLHLVGDLVDGVLVHSVLGDVGAVPCGVDRVVVYDGPDRGVATELGSGSIGQGGSIEPIAIGSPQVDCVYVFAERDSVYSTGTRLFFDRTYPTIAEYAPTPDADYVYDPWNPYRIYDAGDFVNVRLLAVDGTIDCDSPGAPLPARNALLHVWADFSVLDRTAGEIPGFGTPADSILFTSMGADELDNDGDWLAFSDLDGNGSWDEGEPLNDDLGLDGVAGTGDAGEGDGLPTFGDPYVDENGNGAFDPGETYLNRFTTGDGSPGERLFDPGEPQLDSSDPDEFGWYEIRSSAPGAGGTVGQGYELADPDPTAGTLPSVPLTIYLSDNGIDGNERPGALDRELPFLDSTFEANRSLSHLTVLDGSDPERAFLAVLDLDPPLPGSLLYLANESSASSDGAPNLVGGSGTTYDLGRFVDLTAGAADGDPVLYARGLLNPGETGWVDLTLDPGPATGSSSDANADGFPGGPDYDEDGDFAAAQSNGFDEDEDGLIDDPGGTGEGDLAEGVDFGDREVHAAAQSYLEDLAAAHGNGLHADNDYTDNDNDAFFVFDSYSTWGAQTGRGRILWYNVDESRTNSFDDDNDGQVDEPDEVSESVGYGNGENDDDEDGIADGEAVPVPIDTDWSRLAIAVSADPGHTPPVPGPGVDGSRIRVDAARILGLRPRDGVDGNTAAFYANELAYGEVVSPAWGLLTGSARTFAENGYTLDPSADAATSDELNFQASHGGENLDLERVARIYGLGADGLTAHALRLEGYDPAGNPESAWLPAVRFTLDLVAPHVIISGCEGGDPPPDFADVSPLPGLQIHDAGLHPGDYELTVELPTPADEDAVRVTFEASSDPSFASIDFSSADDTPPFTALWPGSGMFTVDNFPADGTVPVYFRARGTDEFGNTPDDAELCVFVAEVVDATAPTATLVQIGEDLDLSDGAEVYLDSTVVLVADLDDQDGVGWVVGPDLATGEAGLDDDHDGATDEDDPDGDGRYTAGVDDAGLDGVPGTDDDEWNGSSESGNLGATDDYLTNDIVSVTFEYDAIRDLPDLGWIPIETISGGSWDPTVASSWNTLGLVAGDYLVRAYAVDVEGNSGEEDAYETTVSLQPIVRGACCVGEICTFGSEHACQSQQGTFLPGVPCEPSPCIQGACCVGEACSLATEAVCVSSEGVFFAGASCDPSPCLQGACCVGSECTVTSEALCGENVFRAREVCSPNPCVVGACCEAELCTLRTRGDCADLGGSFVLAGSCDPDPCNSGACCLAASCTITSSRECVQQDGTFVPASSCDPNPCVLGTCCQDEQCSFTTRHGCGELPGDFLEGGACDPSPCDLGACCLSEEGCRLTTEADCALSGGTFFTNDGCDPDPCLSGACCLAESCGLTSESECGRQGGDFFAGAPCLPSPCVSGACCTGAGCQVVSEAGCVSLGGTFFVGEDCTPNPCVSGACCVDETCTFGTRRDCTNLGGSFLTGVSCDPSPCNSGSCCVGEACSVFSALECAQQGGVFVPGGTCDPDPCTVGACCQGEDCSLLARHDCIDGDGEFDGTVSCDPSPCDLGACCQDDLCSLVSELACASEEGTFFSDQECDPTPCITGACCLDAICSTSSESTCLVSGGEFLPGLVCDPNPCTLGACCLGDECTLLLEAACGDLNGTFLDVGSCDPSPCLSGACCQALMCTLSTEAECAALVGRFFAAVGCDPSPCITGACCTPSGCFVGTEPACTGADEEFFPGDLCTPSPCALGACCLGEACGIESEADCLALGGLFLLGGGCDPNPCVTGACCLGAGCNFGNRADCDAAGGLFQQGMPCDPSPCVPGACCLGEICDLLTGSECDSSGGEFFPAATCDPTPCTLGSCCLGNDCSLQSPAGCAALGGDFFVGVVCDPSPCLEGACCSGTACTTVSEAECLSLDGEFLAAVACDPSPCTLGACCLGGECILASPYVCAGMAGEFVADPACSPSPCLIGACCLAESCSLGSEASCAGMGGEFFAGAACDPSPCVEGACCLGEACSIRSGSGCADLAGTFHPGATCDPSPCLEGACCLWSGCSVESELACSLEDGGFLAGEICVPDPCLLEGSCCFDDGSCRLLTEAGCDDVLGLLWDPDGVCDPSPCSPVIGGVDIVTEADDVFWEVIATPEAAIVELTGWFRPAGESVYRQVTGFERVGDVWVASFSELDRSLRGIEYYLDYRMSGEETLRSFGSANAPRRIGIQATLPVPLPPAYSLRMISAPGVPGEPNVYDLLTAELGPPSQSSWIMAAYHPADASERPNEYVYVSAGSPGAWDGGRGYWLGIAGRRPAWTFTGTTRFPEVGGRDFLLPLSPGWNLVGNPAAYAVTLDPDQLRVEDAGTITTFAERFGAASDLIYVYDPARDPESPYRVAPDRLAIWDGCWIENPASHAITLRIPGAEAGALLARSPEDGAVARPLAGPQLASSASRSGSPVAGLRLIARSAGERREVSIGVVASGEPGRLRRTIPPYPGQLLHLGLLGADRRTDSESGPSDRRYRIDWRRAQGEAESWPIEVVSPNEGIELSWESEGDWTREDGWAVTLESPSLGRRWFLGDLRSLELPAGRHELILRAEPTDGPRTGEPGLALFVDPNPVRGATVVSFRIPGDSRVRLSVYDVAGHHVWQMPERALPAGEHAVLWDGRDRAGIRLAAGAYFVQLEVRAGEGAATETRKIVLLR